MIENQFYIYLYPGTYQILFDIIVVFLHQIK